MVLMNLFSGKEWRHRCREQTFEHSEEGKSGTNRESSINIHTLSCIKQRVGRKQLYSTGNPAWCSMMTYGGMEALEVGDICMHRMAQMAKNLPAMQETNIQSLSQEDHLEKGMAPTPLFLPGKFHGQGSLAGLQRLDRTERLRLSPSQLIHLVVWQK